MEIWKNLTIHPYEEYMISSKGRLRNKNGKIMKTTIDKHGYERLTLNCKGVSKTLKIHRLVAETFLTKGEDSEVVNHIDGNKLNNHVNNLEWTTYSENNSHAIKMELKKIKGVNNPANKYDESIIRKICELLLLGNMSYSDIALKVFGELSEKELKSKAKMIGQIKRKERWSIISDEYFKTI